MEVTIVLVIGTIIMAAVAIMVVSMARKLRRMQSELVMLRARDSGPGAPAPRDDHGPRPCDKPTTAWGRFFDRWEWKPMRLPLLIVVCLAVYLLAGFQDGFFSVFKEMIEKLRVEAKWWDVGLLFGFFGAAVAVFAGGIMAIIALGGNLSTDSPPPSEGVVPQSTVQEILARDEAHAHAIREMAASMAEVAQSFRAALPKPTGT